MASISICHAPWLGATCKLHGFLQILGVGILAGHWCHPWSWRWLCGALGPWQQSRGWRYGQWWHMHVMVSMEHHIATCMSAKLEASWSCMHPAWLWKPLELWHVEATWSSQLKDNWLKSTECSTKKNTHVHASCSCKHHVLYANQQLEKALHANAKMGKGTCFSPLHDVFKIMLPGISHRNK